MQNTVSREEKLYLRVQIPISTMKQMQPRVLNSEGCNMATRKANYSPVNGTSWTAMLTNELVALLFLKRRSLRVMGFEVIMSDVSSKVASPRRPSHIMLLYSYSLTSID